MARDKVVTMTAGEDEWREALHTARLLLRPLRDSDAVIPHELWTERDPRVPPHRRIGADGKPTVADLEESIRSNPATTVGLLAVQLVSDEARRSSSVMLTDFPHLGRGSV